MFSFLKPQRLVLICLILCPLLALLGKKTSVLLQHLDTKVQEGKKPPEIPIPTFLLNLQRGLRFALSPGEALQQGGGQEGAAVHLVVLWGERAQVTLLAWPRGVHAQPGGAMGVTM